MDTETGAMTLDFSQTTTPPVVSHNVSVVLMEDQTQGQLIGNFTLQCLLANSTTDARASASAPGAGFGGASALAATRSHLPFVRGGAPRAHCAHARTLQ